MSGLEEVYGPDRKPASRNGSIEIVHVSGTEVRSLAHYTQECSRRSGHRRLFAPSDKSPQTFERQLLNAYMLICREALKGSRKFVRHFKG